MSTTRDTRNGTLHLARHAAAVLFVLIAGMGYTISPLVKGAVDAPAAMEEREIAEPDFLPSECAVDGLVFADCNPDFN